MIVRFPCTIRRHCKPVRTRQSHTRRIGLHLSQPLRKEDCRAQKVLAQKHDGPTPKESVVEKAARLVKQQQRLAEELAALQSQPLSAEEKDQLQALLTSAPADTRAKGRAGGKVQPLRAGTKPRKQGRKREKDDVQNKDYRHLPDKQPATADEQVPLPPLVQKLFSDAGVQDAVPWEGRPADPPPPDTGSLSYDANLDSHLEELTTKADWAKQLSNSTADEPPEQREDFGTGIPSVPQEEDDEHIADEEEEFVAGAGVAEMLEMLEAGQPLPPDPEYEGLATESSEEFMARMDQLRHAYEAQFLDRQDWKVTPEEFKEAWEGGVEADHPPWDPPEIDRVQPAPDWPPDVQQHYDRFQWVLFLLRKAHLQPSPAAPADALVAAGLASDNLFFEDAVTESIGPSVWQDYMKRLELAGGRMEIGHIWGEMGTERPHPLWRVFADVWLSLPYPLWYQHYFELHVQHARPPNLGAVMPDISLPPDPFEPQPDAWTPLPLRYPKDQPNMPTAGGRGSRSRRRRKQKQEAVEEEPAPLTPLEQLVAFTKDRSLQPSHQGQPLPGEAAGYEFLEALRRCQQQISQSPDADTDASTAKSGQAGRESPVAESPFFHVSKPWRSFQYASADEDPWHGPGQRPRRKRTSGHKLTTYDAPEDPDAAELEAMVAWRPDFGTLPAAQAALDLGDALPGRRDAAETCTFTVELAGAERSFEVLSYPPGRSQRALRSAASALHLSADDMPAWPASKEVGQAWRSGEWLCIPMTLCYTIDNELRQVDKVQVAWGALLGHALGNDQDLIDLYLRQLQLYQDHDPQRQRIKAYRVPPVMITEENLM